MRKSLVEDMVGGVCCGCRCGGSGLWKMLAGGLTIFWRLISGALSFVKAVSWRQDRPQPEMFLESS